VRHVQIQIAGHTGTYMTPRRTPTTPEYCFLSTTVSTVPDYRTWLLYLTTVPDYCIRLLTNDWATCNVLSHNVLYVFLVYYLTHLCPVQCVSSHGLTTHRAWRLSTHFGSFLPITRMCQLLTLEYVNAYAVDVNTSRIPEKGAPTSQVGQTGWLLSSPSSSPSPYGPRLAQHSLTF
jgi:hypothetical protein